MLCGCYEGSKEGPKRPIPIPAPTLPPNDWPVLTPRAHGPGGASDAAGRGIDAQGDAETPRPGLGPAVGGDVAAPCLSVHQHALPFFHCAVDLLAVAVAVAVVAAARPPFPPQGGRGSIYTRPSLM